MTDPTPHPQHPSVASAELLIRFYDGANDDDSTTVHIADRHPFRPAGELAEEASRSVAFLAGPWALAYDAMVEEASLVVHLLRVARGELS